MTSMSANSQTVQQQMDQFAQQYNVLKNPRHLKWQQTLGSVEIELEFDDGSFGRH